MKYRFLQDMKKCSPEGRECIENKSTFTFNCSVACEGIYADVQWVENIVEEESVEDEFEMELFGLESNVYTDKRLIKLIRNLKEDDEMMKGSISQNGDEHDRKKYMKLLSEYRQFKKKEVQHFRFTSVPHYDIAFLDKPPFYGKPIPILSDTNQIKFDT